MQTVNLIYGEFRRNWPLALRVLLLPLLVVLAVALWAQSNNVTLSDLTRDPNTVLHGPAYIGLISNLGIFFWSAAATVCLFTAYLMYAVKRDKDWFVFMLVSGGLSLLLGLDDVFQFHEKLFSPILYFAEKVFFAAYGLTAVILIVYYRRLFFKTEFLVWFSAILLFGLSILVDLKIVPLNKDRDFFEDSFKFAGIVAWSIYYLRTSVGVIKSVLRNSINLHFR